MEFDDMVTMAFDDGVMETMIMFFHTKTLGTNTNGYDMIEMISSQGYRDIPFVRLASSP